MGDIVLIAMDGRLATVVIHAISKAGRGYMVTFPDATQVHGPIDASRILMILDLADPESVREWLDA